MKKKNFFSLRRIKNNLKKKKKKNGYVALLNYGYVALMVLVMLHCYLWLCYTDRIGLHYTAAYGYGAPRLVSGYATPRLVFGYVTLSF